MGGIARGRLGIRLSHKAKKNNDRTYFTSQNTSS